MALSDYKHVRTALFVKIEIAEYLQFPLGNLAPETLLFSDHSSDFTLGGLTYTALGNLVGVSSSVGEISASDSSLTITLSGIPDSSINAVVKSNFLGSPVTIERGFFAQSGELIDEASTPNPIGRFTGFINNVGLEESWDVDDRLSTNTIVIECSSTVALMAQKTSGRKTNSTSMKRHYPNDTSFDRVGAIANADTNFGGAK